QACQDARLPRAHGNTRRTQHTQPPARQGSQAAVGLRSLNNGVIVRSLKGERTFRRLAKGRSGSSKHLSVRWRETRTGEVRVGIVVSRKVGNAVVRNRVRRRLREGLLALLRESFPALSDNGRASAQGPSVDLMIIARPSAATAGYAELKRALATALQRGRVA